MYNDDKRNGEYKSYHPNGQLATIFMYNDDKIDGVLKKYNVNGELIEQSMYENGEKLKLN